MNTSHPFPGVAYSIDPRHLKKHLKPADPVPTMLDALRAARACIMTDRTALADCHMDPVTNTVDAEGQAGLDEYDAVLKQIDGAIATATAHLDAGWALFDFDGTGLMQIQRVDEAALFASDAEAQAYVAAQADAGSKRHREALDAHIRDAAAIAKATGQEGAL